MENLLHDGWNLLVFVSLCTLTIYLISRSKKVMHFVVADNVDKKGMILVILILGVLAMLTTKFSPWLNIRDSIIIFAAIVGGPISGISVGLIGGIYRMTLGDWLGMPCGIAAILVGLLAAVIVAKTNFRPKNINAKSLSLWALFTFAWETIHILLIVPLIGEKPFTPTFMYLLSDAWLLMTIMSVVAIVTFLLLVKDMVLNDSRIALDEQNKLISEVEQLRAEMMKKKGEI